MSFQYRGLSAQLTRHIVTPEEVQQQLERLRQQNPRIASITGRPSRLGDELVLDYAGYCDGKQFEGGTAQNQTLVLGSGAFIPGFEEQLVDKVPGEEVVVKVTFPTEYHAKDLAGKAAEFHCAIREIREKTPYQMDDIFAKEVGRCDTLEQMRKKLTESLQAYTDERGEMDLQDRLLRQAADTLDMEITQEQIKEAVEAQMQTLEAQLSQQGLTLDMYCQFLSTTPEKLREEAEPGAVQSIRREEAIRRIVEAENIQAEQEEIARACALICQQHHITMEQLKEVYDAQLEAAVIRSVLTGKAMELVRKSAQVTEVTE